MWSALLIKFKKVKKIIDKELHYLSEETRKQLFWAFVFLGITITLKILSIIGFFDIFK